MIDKIIDFSLRNRLIIGLLTLAMIAWGVFNLTKLPIDAVPDITNNQVQVITVSPALAPQEVEQSITFPVEIAMANLQDVTEIRSISRFGLSVVTIVFKDKVDPYLARQMVSEQILIAGQEIPEGYGTPQMMPVTTGLGEIFQYVLKVEEGYEDQYGPMELRTIQDWIVKRQLSGIPGIVEVSSFGGYLKQYEVALEPLTLVGMDVTIAEIFDALEMNNQNSGGSYIEKGPNAYYIRAEGLIEDLSDIRQIVVKTINGIPIRIEDIATVKYGSPPRFGAMTRNGEGEAVGGITLMLKGANSAAVISNVKERIEMVQKSLPEGVEIHPYLDRSKLIAKTINTVKTNLTEGGLIVIFFLVLLLGSLRSGLIVASVIPLSMLFAFSMMRIFGVTANLMSLGAIDFGLIVDGSVIVVEGIMYSLHKRFKNQQLTAEEMRQTVFTASSKVANSATFGVIIILIVYLPILVFTGIEGKTFKPMAQTVSFALIGALILSLTYVPMISSIFLKRKIKDKKTWSDHIIEFFHRAHRPVLEIAIRYKSILLGVTAVLVAFSFWLFSRMGGEFLPTLEEGDLAAQMTLPPGSSLSESIAASSRAEKILLEQFPEVIEVVSKIGTAEVPTDPMAVEDADIMIIMKEKEEWVSASGREEMMDKMKEALAVLPGVSFEFTQPIQLRFNELMTGVKSDVAVKIYGEDLDILYEKANEAAALIQDMEGTGDLRVEQVTGLPQVRIKYLRDKLAQFGLNVNDVNKIISTAFAGQSTGVVFEGERRFDLVVRLDDRYRKDIRHIRRLRVSPPNSEHIILEQVADVSIETGPMQISRDDTKRRITIGINVRNRDVESYVEETDRRLSAGLELPPGYYITYGGQFENLQAARESSSIAVPVALALIFILLYFAFRSLKQAVMIFTAIPLAAVGGILALWLRGMPFSISAGVGFIALFGIAVLNGIVLVSYYNQLEDEGLSDILERVRTGTRLRLRPVILTASTDALGFLPMALSTAPGAEVQKPLATVVIGGLISATFLTLVVLPVIYIMFHDPKWWKKMFKSTKTAGLALVLLISSFSLNAQEEGSVITLTESKAIELALQNNLDLKNAQLEAEMARKLKKSATDLPPTNFGFEYGQINSSIQDQSISISQETEFPLVYAYQSKAGKRNILAKESQFNFMESKVKRSVRMAFQQWVYEIELMQLFEKESELYQDFMKVGELRFEQGEISALDRIRIETKMMDIANALILQNLKQVEAENELKLLLNINTNMDLTLDMGVGLEPASVNLMDSIGMHPHLLMMQHELQATRQLTKAERMRLLPGIEFGYFNQSIDDVTGFEGFMGGIRIPLWYRPQQARIQQSAIREEMISNRIQQETMKMESEMQRLFNQQEELSSSLLIFKDRIRKNADKVIDDSYTAWEAGEIDYTEYAQTSSEAYAMLKTWLQLVLDHNKTVINIMYYQGE